MANITKHTFNAELTQDELHALDLIEELGVVLGNVVGWSPTRATDLAELLAKINELRHAVLGQVAARTYPERFPLLGQRTEPPPN